MAGVFAGGIAAAAADAGVGVDPGLGHIVQVQVLPFDEIRHRAPDQVGQGHVLFIQILRQARDHFLHDLEAIGHRRRADLHIARPKCQEFRGIPPGGNAADARDRQGAGFRVAGNLGHHVQRDGLHRRAAIAAVAALAVDHREGREGIQIDIGDRFDRVDQRHGIGPAAMRRDCRRQDRGDVGRQLHDAGHAAVLLDPACHHFDVFGHLPHRAAHAAFGHAMRAAEVQLYPVSPGILDARQDVFPRVLITGHHQADDHGAVGPVTLDLLDLAQVHLQRTVGDKLDVVQAQQAAVRAPDRAVTRAVDVDDGRAFGAKRFPHHAAPAGLERTADVVFLVRWRGRGQPERVGGFDANEVGTQIGHGSLL